MQLQGCKCSVAYTWCGNALKDSILKHRNIAWKLAFVLKTFLRQYIYYSLLVLDSQLVDYSLLSFIIQVIYEYSRIRTINQNWLDPLDPFQ